VSYRRRDIRNSPELKVNITRWQESEAVISGQEMFKEYEISVQSANSKGLAPPASIERKLGYSGQAGMSVVFLLLILQLTDIYNLCKNCQILLSILSQMKDVETVTVTLYCIADIFIVKV